MTDEVEPPSTQAIAEKTLISFEAEIARLKSWKGLRRSGRVCEVVGLLIESIGPKVRMGELCYVFTHANEPIPCEVVGFKKEHVLLMSLGEMAEIAPGAEVYPSGSIQHVPVGPELLGRVIDAMGNPIDGKGPIYCSQRYSLSAKPPQALERKRIDEVMSTGVRAVDAVCTAGCGQRFGIFSGSGVGKSVLMGMIAKMSDADVNVIALIGERGREVREFIERDLGPEGLARSVVVVVTSDQPALLRSKGANAATAIAEYFRDRGKDVIYMMDSITRYAMALREVGLAVGEPPTTKGYTPSVFAHLPKLLERAGMAQEGSITGIYTILVEGDDMNDPVADAVRSILDGHIVLSRKLAAANHFPAIDVLSSLSRVMVDIASKEHIADAGKLRDILQVYQEAEDLINIGAYVHGSNPKIDHAIARYQKINTGFLRQGPTEKTDFKTCLELLHSVVA